MYGREQGKTFRVLLQAILTTSGLGADKNGVVLYSHSIGYSKELLDRAIGIINSYHNEGDFKYRHNNLTILFPNGKTLQFRSMGEPAERNRGINWEMYDELSDHYVPSPTHYFENKVERDMRRGLNAKSK